MTSRVPGLRIKYQRGAVAVEAAICMAFILVPLLALILLFGRYFWYYTAAQKAAHDAATFLASAPLSEIKNAGAAGFATNIIGWETGDLDASTIETLSPTAICGYRIPASSTYISWYECNSTGTPVAVRGGVVMTVADPFFSPITRGILGVNGLPIFVGVNMRYVGR